MSHHICSHGNSGSCSEDYLCQIRLRNPSWAPDAPHDPWQTHSIYACDADVDSWRNQVGPVVRKRGYETRVIRLRENI
jgi:hypothetical protein